MLLSVVFQAVMRQTDGEPVVRTSVAVESELRTVTL